jgi:hypothetical protein
VQACPPSAWYRFRKFARRNKTGALTAASVAIGVVLAIGGLVTAVLAQAVSTSEVKAEQKQTKQALDREKETTEALLRALGGEQRALTIRRIDLAAREVEARNVGRAEELLEECPAPLRGWEWHYLKRRCREEPFTYREHFGVVLSLAVKPDGLAVAARAQVWFLHVAPDIAARVEPAGRHDACFLTRTSHFTGEVQAHELAWAGDELWLVNTAFGCLCTLDGRHSFVPRWRPPFVTALAAEDRCHLNGLAMADGVPRYATALAETDTPQGWRANKVHGGCLIDVAGGRTVARGFAMPHSPRVHGGRVWVLNSGAGRLMLVDPASGQAEAVNPSVY